MIANTPEPPYYAVIFTSVRNEGNNGYALIDLLCRNLDNPFRVGLRATG